MPNNGFKFFASLYFLLINQLAVTSMKKQDFFPSLNKISEI